MSTGNEINLILVFAEGLISFFSPCILPLIPLYLGYLTQNAEIKNEDGSISYDQVKVLIYTLFFILGIATTFFILAYLNSGLAKALVNHSVLIEVVGGIFIIFMALLELNVFKKFTLKREFRLPIHLNKMNLLAAYVLGFTFSFAWTPCIGPMLASVAALAASDAVMGSLYIVIYSLGFMIPFLLLGLFTGTILDWIKSHRDISKYTAKISGVILLVIGLFVTYNGVMDFQVAKDEQIVIDNSAYKGTDLETMNFSLPNREGKQVALSDYYGSKVWLSFIASWCPYCNQEIEALQALYDEGYQIVAVMSPNNGREVSYEELLDFLDAKKVTFPVLFDMDGQVFNTYYVVSLPMNFGLQSDGNFAGYLAGYSDEDTIKDILERME